MTKVELKDLEHAQTSQVDAQKIAYLWRNEAGAIVESILKRCGEDTEKIVKEGRRLNIDFERGVVEVSDPVAQPKKEETPIVMPNGDPVKAEAPKEAVTDIK